MSWKVDVDGSTCIGSGMCVAVAEGCFELADGVSRPVRQEFEPADELVDAAESCPVEAIGVRDESSGNLVAPQP